MEISESVHCIEVTGELEIDYSVRDDCRLPYPGYPEGCPNFGKREECPPHAPLIEDFIDLSRPHYFVIAEYSCEQVKKERKNEEQSQGSCWSYWDGHVKSILLDCIRKFQNQHPGTVFTLHPSAVGVDVFKTARKMGIPLELTPKKTVYRIALIGYSLEDLNYESDTE